MLAAHESPPLSEVLKAVNKPSQNLHAEMMLRLLGARATGSGSAEAGREAVGEFLRRVGRSSRDAGPCRTAPGLSRSDLLTPHEMANLLVAMDRHPARRRRSATTLPVAGVDGTLRTA